MGLLEMDVIGPMPVHTTIRLVKSMQQRVVLCGIFRYPLIKQPHSSVYNTLEAQHKLMLLLVRTRIF